MKVRYQCTSPQDDNPTILQPFPRNAEPIPDTTSMPIRTTRKSKLKEIKENQKRCCKKKCLTAVLNTDNIKETREHFSQKSFKEQGDWLMNFFEISQRIKNGKPTYDYFVRHQKVCQKAWLVSHGISNGRYYHDSTVITPCLCNKQK